MKGSTIRLIISILQGILLVPIIRWFGLRGIEFYVVMILLILVIVSVEHTYIYPKIFKDLMELDKAEEESKRMKNA